MSRVGAPFDLTCEHLSNPLGLDEPEPRLSWKCPGGLARQSAYEIAVGTEPQTSDLWSPGRVGSDQSQLVSYAGKPLEPCQRAWWQVRVWDGKGQASDWSEAAFWEAGLPELYHWTGAQWISAPAISLKSEAPPAPHFRRDFAIPRGKVKRARLYVSAKGLFRAYVNGKRVGDGELTPGWTDYHKRIPYEAHDVTEYMKSGTNAMGLVLADGWFSGNVCWFGRKLYGHFPQALAKLYVEFEDTEPLRVVTDSSWRAAAGPILSADLLMGEHRDLRKDLGKWSSSGYDDSRWTKVDAAPLGQVPIVSRRAEPVRIVKTIGPLSVEKAANTVVRIDMGQNMVGRLKLKVKGDEGAKIRIRHAEILDAKGELYIENLRKAQQIDSYILGSESSTVLENEFTFHGFRYAEVSGITQAPRKDQIEGQVLCSVRDPKGQFRCGSELVNQLIENIRWGMMGNYLEVPTDCPQRDERLGWTGDAQIFAPTAAYNFDIAAFMAKWLQDVRDAQLEDGMFPSVAPQMHNIKVGAPAWGDAGIIVPWTLYRFYGDIRILDQGYFSMVRFIEAIERANPDLLWRKNVGNNYGDWLNVEQETPKDVLATAYFAHSTSLLAQSAAVLGRTDDAKRFEGLAARIRKAFQEEFLGKDGKIHGDTQTAYVLALRFRLLTESQAKKAAKHLVAGITARNDHLATGFLGVGHLLPVLTQIGRDDLAVKLLLNDTYPSWGYSIRQGATTIWERWDGWTEEKGFQDPGMNSFNHYALGSCGEWIFGRVAGISLDPEIPAFKRFRLDPLFDPRVGWVEASFDSPYGLIVSNWRIDGNKAEWDIVVPPNTEATSPHFAEPLTPGKHRTKVLLN